MTFPAIHQPQGARHSKGPRKDQPMHLLGRLVDVLRGAGYHSADEQARVLCEMALALAGASGVMFVQQEAKKQ